MPCFLETDIREQQKHEKRIQTSVDNTVNNPHHSKTFISFFRQKFMFLFLEKYVFKNPKNSIALAFFVEADTKRYRNALAKASEANFECLGKF